ncbi:unnamed protein product, partial [Ilex paraguariensis]
MYEYNDSDFGGYMPRQDFLPTPMVDDLPSLGKYDSLFLDSDEIAVEEEDMNTSESGTNGLQHHNGIRK